VTAVNYAVIAQASINLNPMSNISKFLDPQQEKKTKLDKSLKKEQT